MPSGEEKDPSLVEQVHVGTAVAQGAGDPVQADLPNHFCSEWFPGLKF